LPAPEKAVRKARPCAPLADGQHFEANACGLKYAGASSRAPVCSGRSASVSTVPLLHVGMLPYHSHQRHFFVSNLPRSAGQIKGGSLQVAGEQPTVACLVCEQQRGRTVGMQLEHIWGCCHVARASTSSLFRLCRGLSSQTAGDQLTRWAV
jgi:hypothetical protein